MPVTCIHHRWCRATAVTTDDLGQECYDPVGPWVCRFCLVVRSEIYWERVMNVLNDLGTKLLFDTFVVLAVIGLLRTIGAL